MYNLCGMNVCCDKGGTVLRFPDVKELHLLELAAEAGDEEAFANAASALRWEQFAAEDLAYAVRLALKAGAHIVARSLASQGAMFFPRNPELRRLAAVLAPPRAIHRAPAQDEALEMNRRWLEEHGTEYRSRWVALRRGQLLASAESLLDLSHALSWRAVPASDMLITQAD
jgi:hypothetical protein